MDDTIGDVKSVQRHRLTREEYNRIADELLEAGLDAGEWRVNISSLAKRLGINKVLAGHIWRARVQDKIRVEVMKVELVDQVQEVN